MPSHAIGSKSSSAFLTTLDSAGDVGPYGAITINEGSVIDAVQRRDLAAMGYYDATVRNLNLIGCLSVPCTVNGKTILGSASRDQSALCAITTDAEGYAYVSYYDKDRGGLMLVVADLSRSLVIINFENSSLHLLVYFFVGDMTTLLLPLPMI